MINCKPGGRSRPIRHSNRLLLRARSDEGVGDCSARARAARGIVIQFGGQTPLSSHGAIEGGRFSILGHAVRAVDSPRIANGSADMCRARAIRCPDCGDSPETATPQSRSRRDSAPGTCCVRRTPGRPWRCGLSRSLAGRDRLKGVHGRPERPFLQGAVEIASMTALEGERTYIGALMQHVEEAGGPSATPPASFRGPVGRERGDHRDTVDRERGLGPALASRLSNVQLAVSDDSVRFFPFSMLEVNPRDLADGAIRVQGDRVTLVAAACLPRPGATLKDLSACRAASAGQRQGGVPKVRPGSPGRDPYWSGDGETGEVMASAATCRLRSRRRACSGAPLPSQGAVFIRARRRQGDVDPVEAAFAASARALRNRRHGSPLRGAGRRDSTCESQEEELRERRRHDPSRSVASRCDTRRTGGPEPRMTDTYSEAALRCARPCITTMRQHSCGARDSRMHVRKRASPPGSGSMSRPGASVLGSPGLRRSGRTRSFASTAAVSTRVRRDRLCSRRRPRCSPMSLASPRGGARVYDRSDWARHASPASSRQTIEARLRAARQRFRLGRRAAADLSGRLGTSRAPVSRRGARASAAVWLRSEQPWRGGGA